MVRNESSRPEILGRSVVAGVAGTVVITVFQKLVEMPLTGRPDSYAPAELVEKVLRIHSAGPARWRLNNATHLALGSMWGAAYGVAARAGLRGPRAVAVVFGAVYTGDVVLDTALGLYRAGSFRPSPNRARPHRVALNGHGERGTCNQRHRQVVR